MTGKRFILCFSSAIVPYEYQKVTLQKNMEGVPEALVEVTHGPLVPLEKKMETLL